jgi:predicted nucleotidyltransferase
MARLESYRTHRLLTDSGPLDILTEIDPGLTYPQLLEKTVVHEVAGMEVRSLRLEVVVLSKEHAGRDKDRASLPVLRRVLLLKNQSL